MSIKVTREEIAKGAGLTCITDEKFKTNSAVIRFVLPLDERYASANALAAQLLILSHKKYTGLTAITDFTNKLYGASIGASNFKVGDNQVIAFTANAIRDEYALDGEKLFYELIKVLLECIFEPLEFDDKYFDLKKRELIDSIESEINEKRSYAISNANKYAFKDEPYSLSPNGTKQSAEALTKKQVTEVYKNLLQNASVEASLSGGGDFESAKSLIVDALKRRGEAPTYPFVSLSPAKAEVVKAEDSCEMNQLKMVMLFKTDYKNDSANGLFAALLGGTPFSKLFMNVREKLSLCYYCVSRMIYEKGAMMIDSGIDSGNLTAAYDEILNQIEEIKKGNFTDDELYNTKLAMRGSMKTVYDSASELAAWYFTRHARGKTNQSPDEAQEEMFAVTRDQIIEAAKSIKLDTVYTLKTSGGDK
ncbi:MAG: insulinase family protein [Ruminococcus sp.]|nr:insulinase family protein [Ruminococcus sp.]